MMKAAYIDDLSETLKAVLQDPSFATMFPELAAADIIFDRPSDTLAPPKTTVDLFLYDIREDLDLRSNQTTITRAGNQTITHPAALRLACSFLATAWPVGGTDLPLQEQRLLSEVLVVLSHYPEIPSSFLQGSLVGQQPPLPMVALHPDALKNLAEFWSSLGSKLKASLTVTVTISVPVFSDITDFIVTTENLAFAPGMSSPPEGLLEFGGQVVNSLSQGVAGALVDVLDPLSLVPSAPPQTTRRSGHYVFSQIAAGNYKLRAVATGFKPQVQAVTIPGVPDDYRIQLTPL
ncbi:MAG TPA: Pvc16 family protein [Candidatus Bathyarchaeia archaeon]|nr:Pvc16 family protein [Candidatus Bathyarchaeia archaeon]